MKIFFILIYFGLQAILIYLFPNTNIALLVLIFLLFLTFERICLHIWLEEERNRVKKEGDKIREEYDKFKSLTYREIYTLRKRLESSKR